MPPPAATPSRAARFSSLQRGVLLLLVSGLLMGPLIGPFIGMAGAATAAPDDEGRAGLGTADALWERRAEGHEGLDAASGPIERAIEAYEQLLADDESDLEIRWKLLRALQFYGEHVLEDSGEKLALYERARALADHSLELLNAQIGLGPEERDPQTVAQAARGVPNAVEVYFYSAVHWGLWGETTGKVRAARQGVGGRIRDYAESVVLIDERFDGAGGLRFLGRLHTEAPKIPLFTGWIDRDLAVSNLDRACQLAPESPANQLYLADALLRFRKDRQTEAIERLERVVTDPPRASSLVEDLTTISEARTLLAGRVQADR